ncbi:unnamed protein product [Linum trigynum]|uniref:Secreted protein n=1 Tax=Linum trigynum TaxID=586398 RepID=A0AAV2GJG1_9ROSI
MGMMPKVGSWGSLTLSTVAAHLLVVAGCMAGRRRGLVAVEETPGVAKDDDDQRRYDRILQTGPGKGWMPCIDEGGPEHNNNNK